MVNLTCSSTGGSPPPQIKWYRDGESQLLESTLHLAATRELRSYSVLSVVPEKEDDNAVYRCTVWNRALGQRQKLEARVSLSVNYFPRVSIGPYNPLRIQRGDTAVMTCEVDSAPKVDSVKWTRAGRYIATTFRNVIPTVEDGHEGTYYCEADNKLGQTGKAQLDINILYGPKVSLDKERMADQGEDITVECHIDANPKPVSIQWTMVQNPHFRQTGHKLRLRRVSSANSGTYICTAINILDPSGQEKRKKFGNGTVEISVRHKPGVAFVEPRQPQAVDGKSITLTCIANPTGFPAPSFKWWKNGSPTEILSTGNLLVIKTVRLSSAGQYHCQPHNELGEGTSTQVTIEVVQAPRVIQTLQPILVKRAGDTGMSVSCSGVAKPRATVTWYKQGKPIEDSDTRQMYRVTLVEKPSIPGMAVTVVSTLKFEGTGRSGGTQVMPEDRGKYTCQFKNKVGHDNTTMEMNVEHAPIVTHIHKKIAFNMGQTAYIPCKMKAFPSPTFDWHFKGSPITGSRSIFDTSIRQVGDNEFQSTLKIWQVADTSFGEYTCKGKNSMGATKTTLKLVPKGKPDSPTNLRAKDIGANHMVITWTENFNGGLNDTSFKLAYRELGFSKGKEIFCQHKTFCTLADLKQHTTYIVKVKAGNRHGDSEWSEKVSFTTQIDVSQIPSAETVYFEKSTKSTSFKVDNYPLYLVAKIELQNVDGSWNHYDSVSLKHKPFNFPIETNKAFTAIRVRLCLESNDVMCGAYVEASMVDKVQSPELVTSTGGVVSWVIAVIVGVVVSVIITLVIMVKCCCSKRTMASKMTSKQLAAMRPDILHPSLSFDGKIIGDQRGSGETNGLYNERPPVQYGTGDQGSNGGSLHSQDSLWHAGEEGYNGDTDYAHYPRPEEYLGGNILMGPTNQGNSMHMAATNQAYQSYNGDQYAIPNKVRKKTREDDGIGPYNNSTLNRTQQFHLAFDDQDSLQEDSQTYTPRKVIREIIV